jgi:hypothetical protein
MQSALVRLDARTCSLEAAHGRLYIKNLSRYLDVSQPINKDIFVDFQFLNIEILGNYSVTTL